MIKIKTDRHAVPVDQQLDPEVISFRSQFDQKSPLDESVTLTGRFWHSAA